MSEFQRIHVSRSADLAAAACAEEVLSSLQAAIDERGTAFLAVSGGATPKLLFHHLSQASFDWDKVNLFFVDDRAVPPEDDQSNYKLAHLHFIEPAGLNHVHRIRTELDPPKAADQYVADIREVFGLDDGEFPIFDVMQMGLGDDAHTASLFPGEVMIQNHDGIAAALYVQKKAQWRITLLPRVILDSRQLVFLVAGQDKEQAFASVFGERVNPLEYPAQFIARSEHPNIRWFIDNAARGDRELPALA